MVSPHPNSLVTHNKGRRLDAILVTPAFLEVNPPKGTDTIAYPHARGHLGVTVTMPSPLCERPPPPNVVESVSHSPTRLLHKSQRHMVWWSKEHPLPHGDQR